MSNSNILGRRWTLTAAAVCCGVLTCLVGCGDPIHDSFSFQPSTSEIALTSKEDVSQYEWPLTRDGYVVAKPPQMAYVTSFAERLSRPDPVSAEVVPWSEEGLDENAIRFLNEAYGPVSDQPNVVFSLAGGQFAGPQAFDVSLDGSRLVAIDDEGLALYKTEDGTLIGHLKLPSEVAAQNPPIDAVRFCGSSKDLLVASPQTIFRISGKDGSVAAQAKGCGEPIAQWIVNADDKSMIVRSKSGKIFGGDPGLDYFSVYNIGKDATFDSVSLSSDGTRIGVCLNGVARTYLQRDFQIIDQVDYTVVTLDPNVSISSGELVDAWADGDGLFYTRENKNGPRTTGVYHMFWKPLLISSCTEKGISNWFLTVGRRFADGKENLVLFDYGAHSRNHSLPTILQEMPTRMAHSRDGDEVALLDSRGLHFIRRSHWRSAKPIFLAEWVYEWINEDKIDVLERVLAIVKSQSRLGYGASSEQLRTLMIRAIGDRWRWLNENKPDGEVFARLEAWRKEKSQLAIVASGVRHYRLAWEARGSGYSNTVTGEGWRIYEKHVPLAKAELDEAIAMGDPPLIAFDFRIQAGLEMEEGLDDVDPFCRQASELYPGEVEPHDAIGFKLLPQWYGEIGDALSFALSVSKMLEGSEGDLQYLRFVCQMPYRIGYNDPLAWKSYDSNRVRRGWDEYIRVGLNTGEEPYSLWSMMVNRTRDPVTADRILSHMMKHNATEPPVMNNANLVATDGPALTRDANRIRSH